MADRRVWCQTSPTRASPQAHIAGIAAYVIAIGRADVSFRGGGAGVNRTGGALEGSCRPCHGALANGTRND
jgi:hypothetical protein